jgi:hypothetical protein
MSIPQTKSIVLLESIGFEYGYQLLPEASNYQVDIHGDIEEYLGWQIQSSPVFAVIHKDGHVWIPLFEETEDVERVKRLIRKGVEQDFARAMGVENV